MTSSVFVKNKDIYISIYDWFYSLSVGCYRQWILGMSEINEMIRLPIEPSKSAIRNVST